MPESIDLICQKAATAAEILAQCSSSQIGSLLEAIASGLEAQAGEIVVLAERESRLPNARLVGELGRTTGQLRMFAKDVLAGKYEGFEVTEALPDRQPLPRPKLVRKLLPIGPVVVFGASNFPLAFSVAGGDTASALAAKCPVIVKLHPAHPELSCLVGSVISNVVTSVGLPEGTFSLFDGSNEDALTLVSHPSVKAVGFTGSLRVGRLLMDTAAKRLSPIPVFAEMGSVNPIFVNEAGVERFSAGYVASLTLGVGQFCTNPGIVVGVNSETWEKAKQSLEASITDSKMGAMLTDGIQAHFVEKSDDIVGKGVGHAVGESGGPRLLFVSGKEFLAHSELREEVFGPFGVVVTAENEQERLQVAKSFEGELTASIFGASESDFELIHALQSRVGRLIFDGFPTGVEVCEAMHHGGPYPASSDARFTSVGNHAIERWLRPISIQNPPDFIQ